MAYTKEFSIDFFKDKGYAIIRDAFSKDELLAFRKVFQNTVARVLRQAAKKHSELRDATVGEYCDEGLLALRYADPFYVSIIQRLISRSPEFFRLSSSSVLFSAMRVLLGAAQDSPLYLLSNGIVVTNPNDIQNKRSSNFDLDWHKDNFFTIPHSRYLQFWGPVLRDATEDLGTLILCEGSQKEGIGKQLIHPELSYNYRYSMVPGEADKYSQVSATLELGQMLIFDGRLTHRSGENHAEGKVRTSLIGLCHDASREECNPVATEYKYQGKTPEAWFYEEYQDENAKAIMYKHAAEVGEPVGGV